MQTRVCFNGGEFSPEMAMRSDMEQYYKGVAKLENWELSQMGGIRRRRGLRRLTKAMNADSKLVPFIYSYADVEDARFLIEFTKASIRVLSEEGKVVATFRSGNDVSFLLDGDFRTEQIGRFLLITSANNPVMALERDEYGEWTLDEWRFKCRPWRHVDGLRDEDVTIKCIGGSLYDVTFTDEETTKLALQDVKKDDWLRAGFWLEQAEAKAGSSELRSGVTIVSAVPEKASVGDKFAVAGDETVEYFVCTADWATTNYVSGLDSPLNYPNNFIEAENADGYDDVTPVYSIHDIEGEKITKGTKIAIKSGYWEYDAKFSDFPGNFIRGLPVGHALPCKGEWEFLCSGVWCGSYEVRRNYEHSTISNDWEERGISFSRIAEASNTIITGTEADEECYMRLFLTRSKKMADKSEDEEGGKTDKEVLAAGFPMDSCGNRLIVKGYKHELVLQVQKDSDGYVMWTCHDKVQLKVDGAWLGGRDTRDWSWQAFSERYGYPLHAKVFNKRLVFASTKEQPQTLWFSRTDDLDNFMVTDVDTSSIVVSMDTPSLNPICWVHARSNNLMIGTCEGEYIISSWREQSSVTSSNRKQVGVTSSNIVLQNHGFIGSHEMAALGVQDKVIYVERGSSRVREYGYSLDVDGYRSVDLSILASHILQEHGGVRQMAFYRKPDTVLMAVLNDGQLGMCVYNNTQQIKGWHRWTTDGKFISACSLPDGNNDDKLFFVVHHEQKAANGAVLSTETWVETVDGKSDYTDHGKDYVSYVETNNLLNSLQQRPARDNAPRFWLYMPDGFKKQNDNFNLSTTKGKTWRWDANHISDIPAGWKEYSVSCGWDYECTVSIRVKGNNAFKLLAVTR